MTKPKLQKTIEKQSIYTSRDAGLGYIFAIIIPYALSLLMMIFCIMLMRNGVSEASITGNMAYKIISMCLMPIGFGITFFAYNKIKKISFKSAEVRFKIGWKNTLICVFFAIAGLFLLQYLIGGVNKILELVSYHGQEPLLEATSVGNYFIMLATMALLPAIFEELIFRGIVMHGLKNCFSEWGAILFSALLFALMHGSLEQLVYPFILGTILGWLAMRTGSIFSSMIVHFLNNALVITFDFIYNMTGFSMNLNFNNWWAWIIAIVLAAVMAVIVFLFEKYYFKGKNENCENSEGKAKEKPPLVLWIALALGSVIFLAGTIAGFTMQ